MGSEAKWLVPALLGAGFASLTAIFAKVGVKNVDSNVATAVRTVVALFITWAIVAGQGKLGEVRHISTRTLAFLILSGVGTGCSWLFYFQALKAGEASQVAPVDKLSVLFTIGLGILFLHETADWRLALGAVMMVGGVLLITWPR